MPWIHSQYIYMKNLTAISMFYLVVNFFIVKNNANKRKKEAAVTVLLTENC